MQYSKNHLLIDILNGLKPPQLCSDMLDPLFPVAVAHGLAGLIADELGEERAKYPIWVSFAAELQLSAKFQIQAAREIAAAFQARGIRSLFVKGLSLALTIYRPGVRPFHDVDVIILPEDLPRAHETLKELGFSIVEASRGHPFELSYVRETLPGFRVCIDLHWDFTADDSLQGSVKIPIAELIDRARTVEGIPIPALEDALLLAAANLARKSVEPLMLLVDFKRLIALKPDWGVAVERARAWHMKTPLWLGLLKSRELFHADVPDAVLEQTAPPPFRAREIQESLAGKKLWISDKQQQWQYRIRFKWLCLDSFGDRATVLLGLPKGLLRKVGLTRCLSDSLR